MKIALSIPLLSLFFLMLPPPPTSTLFPYTTLFRSCPTVCKNSWRCTRRIRAIRFSRTPSRWSIRNREIRIARSEEHTSELQSPCNLVCRLLLEKKKERENLLGRHISRPDKFHLVPQ